MVFNNDLLIITLSHLNVSIGHMWQSHILFLGYYPIFALTPCQVLHLMSCDVVTTSLGMLTVLYALALELCFEVNSSLNAT